MKLNQQQQDKLLSLMDENSKQNGTKKSLRNFCLMHEKVADKRGMEHVDSRAVDCMSRFIKGEALRYVCDELYPQGITDDHLHTFYKKVYNNCKQKKPPKELEKRVENLYQSGAEDLKEVAQAFTDSEEVVSQIDQAQALLPLANGDMGEVAKALLSTHDCVEDVAEALYYGFDDVEYEDIAIALYNSGEKANSIAGVLGTECLASPGEVADSLYGLFTLPEVAQSLQHGLGMGDSEIAGTLNSCGHELSETAYALCDRSGICVSPDIIGNILKDGGDMNTDEIVFALSHPDGLDMTTDQIAISLGVNERDVEAIFEQANEVGDEPVTW